MALELHEQSVEIKRVKNKRAKSVQVIGKARRAFPVKRRSKRERKNPRL